MNKKYLVWNVFPAYNEALKDLPWDKPLDKWQEKNFKFIDARKSSSRHIVKFIRTKEFSFAIKQTNPISAYFESETFSKLLEAGIHTLIPAGYVIYKKHLFESGPQPKKSQDSDELAFMITILEARSIPHSILFKWDFTKQNRNIIYSSAAELLADLHNKNIYWGDASLDNILVKFIKLKDENGKQKTELKAFLTDAETVQLCPEINDELRNKDISSFVNSMKELNNSFVKDGIMRDKISLPEDTQYFNNEYENYLVLFKKTEEFERLTGLNIKKHFFRITDQHSLQSILKQIEEHKWYLSENAGKEISLKDSAVDWINSVYKPIIDEFENFKLREYFPETNSLKLYVDIMAHKYYMSIQKNEDVGIISAIKDYSRKYSNRDENSLTRFIEKLIRKISKIVPPNYNL
jgi:hypothetical protein